MFNKRVTGTTLTAERPNDVTSKNRIFLEEAKNSLILIWFYNEKKILTLFAIHIVYSIIYNTFFF